MALMKKLTTVPPARPGTRSSVSGVAACVAQPSASTRDRHLASVPPRRDQVDVGVELAPQLDSVPGLGAGTAEVAWISRGAALKGRLLLRFRGANEQ